MVTGGVVVTRVCGGDWWSAVMTKVCVVMAVCFLL